MPYDFNRLSRAGLSQAFGVSPQSITNWFRSGMPRNADNTYNLPDCFQWCVERARKKDAIDVDEPVDESTKWMTEFRKERAKLAKLERKQVEGQLVDVRDVNDAFTARAYEHKQNLLMMSRRIAHQVAAKSKKALKECQAIIEAETVAYLEQFRRPVSLKGKVWKRMSK